MATNKESDKSADKNNNKNNKNQVTLADRFQSLLKWIDYNVLPILAWPVLLGFAAVGISSFLGNLNHDWRIAIAIGIAAFIGFKAHK